MSFALVLGGGGTVGVAWEIGVLAGLADAGIDPADASVVVGSSAGSVVGTRLRCGRPIDELAEEQRASAGTDGDPPDQPDLTPLLEIAGLLQAADERTPELFQAVGEIARTVDTIAEATWIERIEHAVGTGPWPEDDLRITAVDCNTGQRRVWTVADDVPLAAAVASSCAIPGVFPPIGLDGSRFTDGGLWSSSNLDVVLDTDVDAAIFVGPLRAGEPAAVRGLEREIDRLAEHGRPTAAIVPGEAFRDEIGAANLMNPALRGRGLDLGIADGTAAAERVRALLDR
ncbi:MAG: patatin-like phospholipase family protein [Actinomycetota bacterium]